MTTGTNSLNANRIHASGLPRTFTGSGVNPKEEAASARTARGRSFAVQNRLIAGTILACRNRLRDPGNCPTGGQSPERTGLSAPPPALGLFLGQWP
jgi:hypothetical protein